MNTARKPYFGLMQRRVCLVPTWRGIALIAVLVLLGMTLAVRTVHSFLAVSAPVTDGALVVEGWAPDYVMREALAEFGRHRYQALYVTGGPIEQGALFTQFATYADLGAATLIRLGLDRNVVRAVPAPPVRRDRTFAAARALSDFMGKEPHGAPSINVYSVGVHARRSRLLYERAFDSNMRVGIVAVDDRSYDAQRWWTSSQGFRIVSGEIIAYVYARLVASY